jgi:hypothetical protein
MAVPIKTEESYDCIDRIFNIGNYIPFLYYATLLEHFN